MRVMIGLSAAAVSMLALSAIAGTVEDQPTVESPYTYTLDPDVDKEHYLCKEDEWTFTLDPSDPSYGAEKEAGCRPVNVIRHGTHPMYDVVCWANECCHQEIRPSPDGKSWRVVWICAIDKVKCPAVNPGDPWPMPPPPPPPP